jgi:PAS domain S-box-containing protein
MDDRSERLLVRSKILERVTDGVVSLDADLRYTYVNRRAEEILGVDRATLLGTHVWDAFPEATGTVAESRFREAMGAQRPLTFERYNKRLDCWFEVRVYPDEEGLSICFTDATEHRRAELDLERTNQWLTALVEDTADPVYVKDVTGRYLHVNPAAAALFGRAPDAVVGLTDEDLFDAESAAEIAAVDREILASGNRDLREAVRYVDGERHVFLDDKYPYRDADGTVVGVMGISRDVTDRAAQRQRLDELSEEYEALFANAVDAIFLLDVDGEGPDAEFRFHRLNPTHEAATGLTTDAVRGKTPREALGEQLGAELTANYRRCLEAGQAITYEEELEFPAGRSCWETSLAPVRVNGEVTRIVGIARETTERVERERELEQQNERLDEFAKVVSHDLRSPLTVASGYLHLLSKACDPSHEEAFGRIADALTRMEEIVEDTLTLARDGDTVADADPVPITDLVSRSWGFTDTGDARLVVDDEVTILGDTNRLQHLFQNLFCNAVEHGSTGTPSESRSDDAVEYGSGDTRGAEAAVDHGATDEEPSVTVRVGRFGTDGLYVTDDGPGVPAADREAVFETGYTTTTEGTGFGLAIVRRTAEAHGWSVSVTDGADGGARFEFTGVSFA